VDAEGRALCHLGCPLAATLKDGQAREAEVFLHRKDGEKVPVAVRVSPVVDNSGKLIGAVEVFTNIASQKELERRAKEFEELAYRDSLTGLSSRRHIELKLRQALEEVEEFGRKAGVLLLDIDGFKRVNDMHGHAAGDAVLKTVGERLTEVLRPSDAAGRWGGEEFLLVALDVNLPELEAIAERCRGEIASCPIPVEGKQVSVTVSVGAALLRKGEPADSAVQRADELIVNAITRTNRPVDLTQVRMAWFQFRGIWSITFSSLHWICPVVRSLQEYRYEATGMIGRPRRVSHLVRT
jgi:diguanylate cyclase (GGDEF)-like protein